MEHIFRSLRPMFVAVTRRPLMVIGIAVVMTVVSLMLARNLVIDPDFANLLPGHYPSVQALERMRTTVGGGDVSVDLAIESPSFEANVAFGEALVPEALALREPKSGEPFFVRAELRRDTEFLRDNGLYFATAQELDEVVSGLEDAIYEAKLEANPFFFDLEEDLEEEEEAQDGAELRTTFERIVGKEYYISEDSTVLVVRFFTAGSLTDVGYIETLYGALEQTIAQLNPTSYHAQLSTVLGGRLWRHRVEVRTITDDVLGSFGAGLLAVLFTIMAYFFYKACQTRGRQFLTRRVVLLELARAPLTALLIGIPLFASLTWTAAVAYLSFDTLNLLSSTLGLVLFGLGIDYGIHFYARYIEERVAYDPGEAAVRTVMSTGQAIAVGALTTAAALYALVIADFKGFSQFGFIAGCGVLLALLAMLMVLPALLLTLERAGLVAYARTGAPLASRRGRLPGARGMLAGCVVAVVLALTQAPGVTFEYRFGELEPTYKDWIQIATKVQRAFYEQGRRNPAYIVVDDPTQTQAVVAALRSKMENDTMVHVVDTDTFTTTIQSVESLQERFPVEAEEQHRKLLRIAYIRDTLLADPLIGTSDDIQALRRAAQTRMPIALDHIPDLLRQRFTSKSGEIGNFVTIYPAIGLSDGRKSIAFAEDIGEVTTADGAKFYAGSSSIVAADMLRLMQKEAPYMVLVALVMVMLLMWANFLRVRLALLALLPLLVGVLWMLLAMKVIGLSLNFYNLVVIPAVIGIGNDAGAHLVHRYQEEGRVLKVLRSTGEHVTMGALTTMVGFSGLLLSFHPGLNTVGALALVGIGTTLLAALLLLPAMLQVLEDRRTEKQAAVG